MKIRSTLALALVLCAAPLQALAWGAAAHNENGGGFIHVHAATAEDAARLAVEGCNREIGGPCKLSMDPVRGTTIAVAQGDGGRGTSWAPDPRVAADGALKECAKLAKRCRLVNAAWDGGPHWVALAEGGDTSFAMFNAETREEAIRQAIEGCEKLPGSKGACKLADNGVSDGTQYYARVESAQADLSWYAFSVASMKDAEAQAGRFCAAHASKPRDCKLAERRTNKGYLPEPAGMKQVRAMMKKGSTPAPATGPAPDRCGSCRSAFIAK